MRRISPSSSWRDVHIAAVCMLGVCLAVVVALEPPIEPTWACAAPQSENSVTTILRVHIQPGNRFSGTLGIVRPDQLDAPVSMYTIVPFRVAQVRSQSDEVVALHTSSMDYFTLLSVVTTSTAPSPTKVSFDLRPRIVKSGEIYATALGRGPNYFIVEEREDGYKTLYFRFDTTAQGRPFGAWSSFADGMTVPDEIIFEFPADTTFDEPPRSHRSSNIAEGEHPGRKLADEPLFITDPEFYQDGYLYINYRIPEPPIRVAAGLYLVGVTVAGAPLVILTIGREWLSRKARLRASVCALILAPALIVLGVFLGAEPGLVEDPLVVASAAILYSVGLVVTAYNVFRRLPAAED